MGNIKEGVDELKALGNQHTKYVFDYNPDELEKQCIKEVEYLISTFDNLKEVPDEIVFWTHIPFELITKAYIKKDDNGKYTYEMDNTESTL